MNTSVKILLSMVAALCMICLTAQSTDAESEHSEENILIDLGNGQTFWSESEGVTLREVLDNACTSVGLTFSDIGGRISIDGLTERRIGSEICEWTTYIYDDRWIPIPYDGTSAFDGSVTAVGFYPEGIAPTVTPAYKVAWTSTMADSLNSGNVTDYDVPDEEAFLYFTYSGDNNPSCYASPLFANGHVYLQSQDYVQTGAKCHMISFDLESRTQDWIIDYAHRGYNLSTGAIYGDSVYFSKMMNTEGLLDRVNLTTGEVTNEISLGLKTDKTLTDFKKGSTVMSGLSSIVFDSGHLFFGSSNGKIYCMDPSLNMVWNFQMMGGMYPSTSLSIAGGLVYIGACDGTIYILDECTGELVAKHTLYYENGGRVGTPAVMGDTIIVSYNDGKGMSCKYWACAVLKLDTTNGRIEVVADHSDVVVKSNYLTIPYDKGYVYAQGENQLLQIGTNGGYSVIGNIDECHGGLTLVNGSYLYATDYKNKEGLVVYTLDSSKISDFPKPTEVYNFSMGSTAVCGEYVIAVTDSGAFVMKGSMTKGITDPPEPPSPPQDPVPDPSSVRFVLADDLGFYITVEGTGVTVLEALESAMRDYGYSEYCEFESYGILSMFGMGLTPGSDGRFSYWNTFLWDEEGKWTYEPFSLDILNVRDFDIVAICYGDTDGLSADHPGNIPGNDATPLPRIEGNVDFLIESESTMFFWMSGTGPNAYEAFLDACTSNNIPHSISDGKIGIMGLSNSDDSLWQEFGHASSDWESVTMDSTQTENGTVFALTYGKEGFIPTMDANMRPGDGTEKDDEQVGPGSEEKGPGTEDGSEQDAPSRENDKPAESTEPKNNDIGIGLISSIAVSVLILAGAAVLIIRRH